MKYIILIILLASCNTQYEPKVADLEPPSVPFLSPATRLELVGFKNVPRLLVLGNDAMENEQYGLAMEAYKRALATNQLNERGMSLAFWCVYESSENIGDGDLDYLHSFLTVGEELLENIDSPQRIAFVKEFNLQAKVDYAKLMLESSWEISKAKSLAEPHN